MVYYSRTTFQLLDDESTNSQDERDIAKGVNSTGGSTSGQKGVDLGYLNASYLKYSYFEPVYFDPFTEKIRAEQFSAKS